MNPNYEKEAKYLKAAAEALRQNMQHTQRTWLPDDFYTAVAAWLELAAAEAPTLHNFGHRNAMAVAVAVLGLPVGTPEWNA